jgi:Outer membrane lipoprotein-sorting protein
MPIAFARRPTAAAALVAVLFLYYEWDAPAGFDVRARQPESAEWVARQVDARDIGKDGRFQLKMRLFDRQQRVRERELTILSLRGQSAGKQGAGRAGALDGDRVLIRFTYPNDIKGTAFLVWEHAGSEDERFLYLPALARVRRIAGAEAQDNFVGSDFSYEDISGREFDDYTYAMVEPNATWTAPDSQRYPAYRIESRARDAQARFPRVVSTVRKDNFVVVHADIFNRRDERQKTYEVRKHERIQGIWTLSDVVMTNLTERTRTELVNTSAEYNVGLKESDFSRRELERK